MAKIVNIKHTGDFSKTESFLHGLKEKWYYRKLDKYGRKGVEALAAATPKDTGLTASSWEYRIVQAPGKTTIYWTNTHVEKGVNIAIILQYGHGTRNGGYVEGVDYINPSIKPIFDRMLEDVWKEVVES